MSTKYLNWAFQVENLKPTPKIILLWLADLSNENGQCEASIVDLMIIINVKSKGTVIAAIKKLTAENILTVDAVTHRDGSRSANKYTIKDWIQ